ncbi:MAG: hypothetical protein LBL91_02810 [Lachnospiraceae bacterium]|jgi:23S rRNA pseudouridine1911/1915/1917 synthase|nr:hypothetical protein [Lachnospiraceae bacterium]
MMKNYKIDESKTGERLDKIIAGLDTEISRMSIKRLIESGKVKVNNTTQKPSYKVLLNDEIIVEEDVPKETGLVAEEMPLDIVYEDPDIIVINKPKGMVVHPRKRKFNRHVSKCCNGKV